MNNQKKLMNWGISALRQKGYMLEQTPEIVVQTPWSTVIRFLTSKGSFYLKQTPPDLFIETKIIKAIQNNMENSLTPRIISQNPDLNCYIMASCGNHSLRTKFNGVIDAELLVQGLKTYIKIIRSSEQNLEIFEKIGMPDWRIHRIPDLFVDFLNKKDMLLQEGLTQDELDKLIGLVPTIQSICDSISENKIKNTLVNGDFNENNMISNESTHHISLIDWGESVITHPFFSIASLLRNNARRYKLDLNGLFLEDIKQKCLSNWLDVASEAELNTIYQSIQRILPIFSTLAIHRLQVVTHNKSKELQNWFIAGFLRSLLENESKNVSPT